MVFKDLFCEILIAFLMYWKHCTWEIMLFFLQQNIDKVLITFVMKMQIVTKSLIQHLHYGSKFCLNTKVKTKVNMWWSNLGL